MPEGPSGSDADKSAGGSQRGRKPPHPTISEEALAALERHYGGINQESVRGDSDAASATGFAAMLAHGSVAGSSAGGSSGALPAINGGQESGRRDSGEIPEAKIIAVRPDSAAEEDHVVPDAAAGANPSTEDEHPAPVVYASTPVEDVEDPQLGAPLPERSRPLQSGPRRPGRSRGMPEHYKALIPILIAMGLGALAVGVWAAMQFGGSSSTGSGGHPTPALFINIAVFGIPLGLSMLGLSGFILKRYWNKG